MFRSSMLKCLGILFVGIIILGILGRMGHMIMGLIMMVLCLIGAIWLFKKLTGVEGDVHFSLKDRERGKTGGAGQPTRKAVEQKQQIPGPGQVLCPHCGTINSLKAELCETCGWPLPAKVQQAAGR